MKALLSRPDLVLVAVCTVAVVTTFAVFITLSPRFATMRPAFAPTPTPLPPVLFTPGALYAPADHDRLMKIGTALQKKQPIKDADLEWALALLQRGPVIDSPFTRTSFALRILSQLGNHHSLTPDQSRTLAIAVAPYADDPPPKDRAPIETETGPLQSPAVSLQSVAVITLASLDDDLAHAKLKSLAYSSATPKIRQEAGGFLQRQRERHSTPPAKK